MGEERREGLGPRRFAAFALGIAALVAAQSLAHLVVVLRVGRIGTFVDLDRSNGLPDIVSTIALATASLGAALLAHRRSDIVRNASRAASLLLAILTLADLLHDGAHPMRHGRPTRDRRRRHDARASRRRRAPCFDAVRGHSHHRDRRSRRLLPRRGLERFDPARFQRERGDPITERQIVAKEGLELARLVARRARALGRGTPPSSPHARCLQRELLEHRLHRDDMPLEAELRVREARRDADQLREVQDRHLEVLPGLLLELRLPRVE